MTNEETETIETGDVGEVESVIARDTTIVPKDLKKAKAGDTVSITATVVKTEGNEITFEISDSDGKRSARITLNGSQLESVTKG